MDNTKKIRLERKRKLKRIVNYDAEMAFLEKFWELKKRKNTIDEFKHIVKITLIDTKQISETIGKYFIEDLYVKEKIEGKKKELDNLNSKRDELLKDISSLEDSIDDADEIDLGFVTDPCTRSPRRSMC